MSSYNLTPCWQFAILFGGKRDEKYKFSSVPYVALVHQAA